MNIIRLITRGIDWWWLLFLLVVSAFIVAGWYVIYLFVKLIGRATFGEI